jgi:hypothetical protein
MAEYDDLPKIQDETDDLRHAEELLRRGKPNLGRDAHAQEARSDRIDHWMQASLAGNRRRWWQFWKG